MRTKGRTAAFLAALILASLSCARGIPPGGTTPTTTAGAIPTRAVASQAHRVGTTGYLTLEARLTDAEGRRATVPLSAWYPTTAQPVTYRYPTLGEDLRLTAYSSSLAPGAAVQQAGAPYPLILFTHGAYTCGTQSLFLTEHLATQGYLVVAPDFPDDLHLCGDQPGLPDSRLEVLRGLREIRRSDEREQLAMLARGFRVPGVSAILDQLLAWNGDPDSPLYEAIDEARIGAVGHSFGGETILGLVGAHPNPAYREGRIRAVVILSGAVFPFQDRLGEIELPLMAMQGDRNDNLDLHGIPRREAYAASRGPGYFLMLEGGTHGSFANGQCPEDRSVRECALEDPLARAINEYTAAFFDKYLKGDPGAEAVLGASRLILREYERRE